MALIYNNKSELIREPNLLAPGKKPVGSVRVDDQAIPSSFGECILAWGFANSPTSCIRRNHIGDLSVGAGGYDRKSGGFYFLDDNQYITSATNFPYNSGINQTWIISFSIWSPMPEGESNLNYIAGAAAGGWFHAMFSGAGDSKEIGMYRTTFIGFGIYQSDFKVGWNRVTIIGNAAKQHSVFLNNSTKGSNSAALTPYYLRVDHFFNEYLGVVRQRGPGLISDLMVFWKKNTNALPSDEQIWEFNRDPYCFLTPA